MSIEKTKNGRWRAHVKAGRVAVASKTFDTKGGARDWERTELASIAEGFDPRAGKRTSVCDAFAIWVKQREGSVAETTLERDKSIGRNLPRSLMKRPVGVVTSNEVASVLKKYGKTSGTRNRAKITLSAFFSFAIKAGYRRDNPVKEVRLASGATRAWSILTMAEVEELADSAEQEEYRRLIRVLGYLGLRWGEARALKVRDVGNGMIHLSRSWSDGHTEKDVKQHQERSIPLFDIVKDDVLSAISGKGRDDRVFLSPRGNPISSRNLRRAVNWNAKVPGYRIHDLRHSAISEWLSQGIEIETVRRWAGHESLATTNRYVHSTGRASRRATERLNHVWGSDGGPRSSG